MDIKDTTKLYKSDNILLSDSNYYKFIFKKTEKIVCVVFYVLEHADKSHNDLIATSVLESAKRALDSALRTLSCRWYTAYTELYTMLNALVALESNIHVAQTITLIQEEIADILSLEISAVARSLRHYLAREQNSAPDMSTFAAVPGDAAAREGSRQTAHAPFGGTPTRPVASKRQTKGQSKGQREERRRMIKDILASNRQSTIKDITEKIPNWSEKTVQREITSMLNESIVIKEGERRWSRYSLVPGV